MAANGKWGGFLIIVGLMLHAMFGANGMVIYRQKRDEMQTLQQEVERLQKENNQYADQIKSLIPIRRLSRRKLANSYTTLAVAKLSMSLPILRKSRLPVAPRNDPRRVDMRVDSSFRAHDGLPVIKFRGPSGVGKV